MFNYKNQVEEELNLELINSGSLRNRNAVSTMQVQRARSERHEPEVPTEMQPAQRLKCKYVFCVLRRQWTSCIGIVGCSCKIDLRPSTTTTQHFPILPASRFCGKCASTPDFLSLRGPPPPIENRVRVINEFNSRPIYFRYSRPLISFQYFIPIPSCISFCMWCTHSTIHARIVA